MSYVDFDEISYEIKNWINEGLELEKGVAFWDDASRSILEAFVAGRINRAIHNNCLPPAGHDFYLAYAKQEIKTIWTKNREISA